eukprot:1159010-Pelagomonas_calceolata.AAC.19
MTAQDYSAARKGRMTVECAMAERNGSMAVAVRDGWIIVRCDGWITVQCAMAVHYGRGSPYSITVHFVMAGKLQCSVQWQSAMAVRGDRVNGAS